MSMLYSSVMRSGPLRARIPRRTMMKMAKRYWGYRTPPSADGVFSMIKDRYQRRFGRPLPPVMNVRPTQPSPFIPMLPRTETQQAQRMGGTPLQRLLVAPDMVGAPAAQAALQYQSSFRPEWVDDRQWGATGNVKTLPEIIGSGMLTQEQMQNLSISNVLSLFDFRGGSEQDRLEFGYLLQRFIMDGYIRGVDVYKYIKDTSQADGARFVIGLMTEEEMKKLYNPGGAAALASSGGLGALGMNNNANYTLFTDGYWRDAPENERFGMFYHEWGHQLGLPHAGDGGYTPSGPYGNFMGGGPPVEGLQHIHFEGEEKWLPHIQQRLQQQIDSLFQDAGRGTGASMGNKLERFTPQGGQPVPTTPPAGFPQIGGSDQNNITVDVQNREVYNISPTQIQPASPQPMDLMSGGGTGSAGTPEEMDKTPVAGMLPSMPQLQSFAAGLGDVMAQAQPMLNNLAGSLLKRKGA